MMGSGVRNWWLALPVKCRSAPSAESRRVMKELTVVTSPSTSRGTSCSMGCRSSGLRRAIASRSRRSGESDALTANQTMMAALTIRRPRRMAERKRIVCASWVRASVVSATVTVKGMARTPDDAARWSTARRMGSPRKVASEKAISAPLPDVVGRFW